MNTDFRSTEHGIGTYHLATCVRIRVPRRRGAAAVPRTTGTTLGFGGLFKRKRRGTLSTVVGRRWDRCKSGLFITEMRGMDWGTDVGNEDVGCSDGVRVHHP
ncbi:hypothetical protein BDZ89DRAFT_1061205 [Hymenopellis radicata]|nr:hypothetical protein BDZ89DRAFT_1061205 [Hymenopellis radicata]